MVLIFNIFMFLLAAYGATMLIISIIESVRHRIKGDNTGIRLVLLVKNNEDIIEGIVRSFFLSDFFNKTGLSERFTILDMGSSDGTQIILERLKTEFDSIDLVGENDKERIFSDFRNEKLNEKIN
ncbi:MAG TPA: hypothetical protein VF941_20735 [Clostridia bacterium]